MQIKVLFLLITMLANEPAPAQNILQALQLKYDSIGIYEIGELRPNDTIIDLRNGYYEESLSSGDGHKHIIQQAALFHNHDGSKTLGISIEEYDFVCFFDRTNFYKISKSKDHIDPISIDDILPDLQIRDFVTNSVIAVLNKYLPEIQGSYLDATATLDKLLSEVYYIDYLLPRTGTNIIATLGICDYISENEISIAPEDWAIIENGFMAIELEYDRVYKKFTKGFPVHAKD